MVIAVSRWPKPITGCYRQLAGGDAATSPRPSTGPWQLFNWIETSNQPVPQPHGFDRFTYDPEADPLLSGHAADRQ
jgi:hypothetical protein